MAMLDRFKGLFKKKDGAEEPDLGQVSNQELAELAAARLAPDASDQEFAESRMQADDDRLADDSGLVALPVLGRKPADQHRRLLTALLGLAVLVLAASYFAPLPPKVSSPGPVS